MVTKWQYIKLEKVKAFVQSSESFDCQNSAMRDYVHETKAYNEYEVYLSCFRGDDIIGVEEVDFVSLNWVA